MVVMVVMEQILLLMELAVVAALVVLYPPGAQAMQARGGQAGRQPLPARRFFMRQAAQDKAILSAPAQPARVGARTMAVEAQTAETGNPAS